MTMMRRRSKSSTRHLLQTRVIGVPNFWLGTHRLLFHHYQEFVTEICKGANHMYHVSLSYYILKEQALILKSLIPQTDIL